MSDETQSPDVTQLPSKLVTQINGELAKLAGVTSLLRLCAENACAEDMDGLSLLVDALNDIAGKISEDVADFERTCSVAVGFAALTKEISHE